MKKLFTYFFVTLGVIFFVLLCVGSYIWLADPFHIRPLFDVLFSNPNPSQSLVEQQKENDATVPTLQTKEEDKNPALSEEQEKALEKIGVDPAKLPTTITPEMESCFVEKLGVVRVTEIQQGATPTPTEFFTARECLE